MGFGGAKDLTRIHVGCAGWTVPSQHAEQFPCEGSHLERYAARLNAVEINSTFYRPHRPATFARWASSVPADFRFAVKAPKAITHEHRLVEVSDLLPRFLSEIVSLGAKLGPLLVQLPPSLAFDASVVGDFFDVLRKRFTGAVVCEPRHATWFTAPAEEMLTGFHVGRVAADPTAVPAAATPGGWPGVSYYRLHGSPEMYYSEYSNDYLDVLSARLRNLAPVSDTWCIFDNTARGHAVTNALDVGRRLR